MKDDSINFIVVVGGEKAFCAGGDIKGIIIISDDTGHFSCYLQLLQTLVKWVLH